MRITSDMIHGCYLYRRVGYDERLMELLPDGGIGQGNADCERTWSFQKGWLALHGTSTTTCQLWQNQDGVWRGRSGFGKRMQVELTSTLTMETPAYCVTQQSRNSDLLGVWLYYRVGYDQRHLEFRSDGTIGTGAAGAERSWHVELAGQTRLLTIYGDDWPTCHFIRGIDGVWRGHWFDNEVMPVELRRCLAGSVFDSPTSNYKVANMSIFLRNAPSGPVVEVGVYQGGSMLRLASRHEDRLFWGFDTWEGIPETTPHDNYHKQGDFRFCYEACQLNMAHLSNVVLIKGRFPESALPLSGIVLAHVDVDTYTSTLETMEFLIPRMRSGGRIYCDDAYVGTCRGATKAIEEVAAKHHLEIQFDRGRHAWFSITG